MNKRHFFLSLAAGFLPVIALASKAVEAQGQKESLGVPTRNFDTDFSQIRGFAKTKNLKGLESHISVVLPYWKSKDESKYLSLVEEAGAVLTGFNFKDARQYSIAKKSLEPALLKPQNLPLSLETTLVNFWARADVHAPQGTEKPDVRRKQTAKFWLHAVRRIEQTEIPTFDKGDVRNWPRLNVAPPGGIPGADPKNIKDPKVRKQYEVAIASNNNKAQKLEEQREAKELKQTFLPMAQAYLLQTYKALPQSRAELNQLFAESKVSSTFSSQVLSRLREQNQEHGQGSGASNL